MKTLDETTNVIIFKFNREEDDGDYTCVVYNQCGSVNHTINVGFLGSREEDEVSGFFVLSHLWMRGYFRLG